MSELLKRYEESISPSVENARKQSDGDQSTAVNFFDIESTYQDNFTTRDKGNKTVTQSNVDDDTAGNFTDPALTHYDQEVTELANGHHIHKKDDYVNKNAGARGITYQSTAK